MRINKWVASSIFALAIAGLPMSKSEVRGKENARAMFEEIERASRQLEEFENTKEVTDLENSIAAAEHIGVSHSAWVQGNPQFRHRAGILWLSILAAIDRNLDPKFDPNDLPPGDITPPPSGAIKYPSGIDPKDVHDPAARAQYEAALEENSRKAKRYRLQTKLGRLGPRVSTHVDTFVTDHYTNSPSDLSELERICDEVKLSPIRKRHLKSLILPRSSPSETSHH